MDDSDGPYTTGHHTPVGPAPPRTPTPGLPRSVDTATPVSQPSPPPQQPPSPDVAALTHWVNHLYETVASLITSPPQGVSPSNYWHPLPLHRPPPPAYAPTTLPFGTPLTASQPVWSRPQPIIPTTVGMPLPTMPATAGISSATMPATPGTHSPTITATAGMPMPMMPATTGIPPVHIPPTAGMPLPTMPATAGSPSAPMPATVGVHPPTLPALQHTRRKPPTRPIATHSMPSHALRKFWTDWAIYKHLADVPPNEAPVELYLSCDGALQSAVLAANQHFTSLTEPQLTTINHFNRQ
ncbi:uncharacterized protein LOC126998126 [Eriocheir sinensis]|uniref:uncharacterized protein LOC126998126 n=1 Tax=Eriocheir sinensis TaxID=95602 RepID=UPI0021C70539|nr:uncharacterized protein LOC126998126 [Eriocheir sinensis]